MKKTLAFFAVVAFAAVSQAASFNWGSAVMNSQKPEADGWADPGTVINLIRLGTTIPSSAADYNATATTYYVATGLTNLGGELVDTYTYTEEDWEGGDWLKNFVYPEDKINAFYMATIYDASTPDYFDSIIFEMTGIADNTGAPQAPMSDLGNHMKLGVVHEEPIPEPATAALLALGLAAFGLRRKARA